MADRAPRFLLVDDEHLAGQARIIGNPRQGRCRGGRTPWQAEGENRAASFGALGDVVEDDAMVRDFVVQQLRQLGYRTRLAGNGREALAALDGGSGIDLLLAVSGRSVPAERFTGRGAARLRGAAS